MCVRTNKFEAQMRSYCVGLRYSAFTYFKHLKEILHHHSMFLDRGKMNMLEVEICIIVSTYYGKRTNKDSETKGTIWKNTNSFKPYP